jgi:hypothetical protein
MGAHETRTYRSGKAVALRLPSDIAIPAGETIRLEQDGDLITLRRVRNRAGVTRKLRGLLPLLEAIGYPAPSPAPLGHPLRHAGIEDASNRPSR